MQIDPCGWRNTSRMPRACRYNNEPQLVLNYLRATPTGVKNVHDMYCNDQVKSSSQGFCYAANVGDLLNEIGQGSYIIVPVNSKSLTQDENQMARLDFLVHKTTLLASQLHDKVSHSAKLPLRDLKTTNAKRQRVEAFQDSMQQLAQKHKIQDVTTTLSSIVQSQREAAEKAALLAQDYMDISCRSKDPKPWDDPKVVLDHLMVRMRSFISSASWTVLRRELDLTDVLTPSYLMSDLKKEVTKYTAEAMRIEEFTFEDQESTPEAPITIQGTSVGLKEAMMVALDVWKAECKKQHIYCPRQVKWKITLDGRPLAGHDQVCVGMVPLIQGLKFQSADSVFPLMLFNGRESKHNLHTALKGLAEEMKQIKADGLSYGGDSYSVSYILCCDMSSLWKIFIDKSFGDDFCVFCQVSKAGRWDLYNPEFQELRTDLKCIFPVDLTEIVFCGLHARIRIVDKLMAQLAQTAYDKGSQKGVKKLVEAVRQAGVDGFNIDQKTLKPTSLIGGNCTKILRNHEKIVASVEEEGSQEKVLSLKIWSSVSEIDQGMRAKHEEAQQYLQQETEYSTKIQLLCHNLAEAYSQRYSCAVDDPENEGKHLASLDAAAVNFYLHYVLAHMPTLMERFVGQGLSIGDLSQEGFENAHKLHRLIYAKATHHDGGRFFPAKHTSMTQILVHQYANLLRRAGRLTISEIKKKD